MADEVAERVQEIINQADEELKSVAVVKDIELEYDLGNLLVNDKNSLDAKKLRDGESAEDYLQSLARDGVQALLTKVWDLPSQRTENMIYASLPTPTTRLPREKKVPKGKALTRWEQFAREKGFNRRKKDKKVWDDTLKKWIPRFGFKKVQAEKEKNWVREVPENADPYEDQFAKAAEMKKERIAKNEFQRLRNIAKNKKVKVPSVGVTGNELATSSDLGAAIYHAKKSTASLGKFQENLKHEKPQKGVGKKRKLESATGDLKGEKKRALEILDKLHKPDLSLEKAVDQQLREENAEMNRAKDQKGPHTRRSKMGGRRRGPSEQKAAKLGKGIYKSMGKKGKGGGGNFKGKGKKAKA
ncbi:ribosome biogenesis regulatory protein homolog [Oratosquilla oratoria]|uniref:ribosome biogenesis regulatory protein homolog n=1 Tax=Oratosquilla oratoria TaxID=337810 RepID=UPI003F77383B